MGDDLELTMNVVQKTLFRIVVLSVTAILSGCDEKEENLQPPSKEAEGQVLELIATVSPDYKLKGAEVTIVDTVGHVNASIDFQPSSGDHNAEMTMTETDIVTADTQMDWRASRSESISTSNNKSYEIQIVVDENAEVGEHEGYKTLKGHADKFSFFTLAQDPGNPWTIQQAKTPSFLRI